MKGSGRRERCRTARWRGSLLAGWSRLGAGRCARCIGGKMRFEDCGRRESGTCALRKKLRLEGRRGRQWVGGMRLWSRCLRLLAMKGHERRRNGSLRLSQYCRAGSDSFPFRSWQGGYAQPCTPQNFSNPMTVSVQPEAPQKRGKSIMISQFILISSKPSSDKNGKDSRSQHLFRP